MTNTEIKTQIDNQITNETIVGGITPFEVGSNIKSVVDYVDQQAPIKTSGTVILSLTPQVLPYDINACSFAGGKAYLPATNIIGKEVYVIAVYNNIEIRANVANTSKLFSVFNTFVPSITLTTNQIYRFIYIGFDTEGYWKAELI
jgi:hypothetical protein